MRPTAAAAATKAWQHAAARPAARRPRLQQQLCRAAAEAAQQPEAAAAQGAGAKASAAPNKPKLMSAAWEQAVAWQKESAELEGTIAEANRSGLKIPLPNKLTGFLPYKLLDPARLDGVDRSCPGAPAAMKALVGSKLRFKVTQVRPPPAPTRMPPRPARAPACSCLRLRLRLRLTAPERRRRLGRRASWGE